jgi:hypothetical protein
MLHTWLRLLELEQCRDALLGLFIGRSSIINFCHFSPVVKHPHVDESLYKAPINQSSAARRNTARSIARAIAASGSGNR